MNFLRITVLFICVFLSGCASQSSHVQLSPEETKQWLLCSDISHALENRDRSDLTSKCFAGEDYQSEMTLILAKANPTEVCLLNKAFSGNNEGIKNIIKNKKLNCKKYLESEAKKNQIEANKAKKETISNFSDLNLCHYRYSNQPSEFIAFATKEISSRNLNCNDMFAYEERDNLNRRYLELEQAQREQEQNAYWGAVAGQIADIYRPDPVTTCTPAAGGVMRCVHSDGRP